MRKNLCKQFYRDLKYAKDAMVLFEAVLAKDDFEQAKIHRIETQRFVDGIIYQLKAKDFVWDAVGNNVLRYKDKDGEYKIFDEDDVRNKIIITRRLIKIDANVKFDTSRNVELPENLYVNGDMDFTGSSIDSLPEFLNVVGYLKMGRSIKSLPKVLRVGRDLIMSDVKNDELWEDVKKLKEEGYIKGEIF